MIIYSILLIIIKLSFAIVISYFLLFFVLSRFFIPYFNKRIYIPEQIPKDMEKVINNLKKQSKNKKEFLEKAHEYLSKKYFGEDYAMFKDPACFFQRIDSVWTTKGFMPCNIQNQMLIIFLIKSGFFKKQDIKKIHMYYYGSIHQYIEVKINNKSMPVDIWSTAYGVKMGDRPKGI
jgi:hypothetical protein